MYFHFYADDAQVYIKTKPNPFTPLIKLKTSQKEMRAWMSTNFPHLNGTKTKALLIGTLHQIELHAIITPTVEGHITDRKSVV